MQELKEKIIDNLEKELDNLEITMYDFEDEYAQEDYEGDFKEYIAINYDRNFIDYQNEIYNHKTAIEMNLEYLECFQDEETYNEYKNRFEEILYNEFTPEQIKEIIEYYELIE